MRNPLLKWPPVLAMAWGLALGMGLSSCSPKAPPALTFESALDHLQLASVGFPENAVSDMVSSYDRMGGNVDWANLKECWIGGDNYLFADLKGPGCVRRLWQTNVAAQDWLFYFDGEDQPRIRIAETNLFGYDKTGPMPFISPLADGPSGGAYSYVPIPYQKGLRIVVRMPKARPDARPYFQVTYETYPPGTRVESYPEKRAAVSTQVVDANAVWRKAGDAMREAAAGLDFQSVTARPSEAVTLFEAAKSPGTVTLLAVRLAEPERLTPVQRAQALRHLVLRCTWDESAAPSVDVPLGDFFCNGLHLRRFSSLVMANVEGTLLCRFPMPFRNGARIEIRNDGPFAVSLQTAVKAASGVPGKEALYFHAAWNQALSGGTPLRVMHTAGSGSFLGCYLIALGADGGWNILEGDDFFFRDGSPRPVHHGTGLEDYFNAGWYYYGLFERPCQGLLEKAAMRTCQYRFHVPDPVTFTKNLQMQFEFGDGNRAKGYMSAASYWYQDKPGPADSGIPPAAQRFPPLERVGVAASMCEIFELERSGLDREAEERSAYYAGVFGDDPLGRMYDLRALAYREMREGSAAVREAYRERAEKAPAEVAEQAKLLLWRSEKPNRALFGGFAYSMFRLFADDRFIGEGGHPLVYQAFPVELEPGPHTLRAEIVSKGDHAWYALGFASAFTTVVSDVSWDYAVTKPEGWPASDGNPALWKPYAVNPYYFPTMQWWQFAPNGFPFVQSGQEVGGPFGGWEKPEGRTIYLRRRITVPAEPGAWSIPYSRSFEIRTLPIRPASDTSNEGLKHGT